MATLLLSHQEELFCCSRQNTRLPLALDSDWEPNKFCFFQDKFGIDKRIINLSAQVLSGSITRDEAINQLKSPALKTEDKKDLHDYIPKKLDLSEQEYKQIWNSPPKYYYDYPNYEHITYRLLKHSKPLIKLIYKQMPMTFVEMEMNKKKTWASN